MSFATYVFCICLLTYTNKYHKYKSVELGDQLGVNKKMMKNRIIIFFAPVALLSTRYTEISDKSNSLSLSLFKNLGNSFFCVQLFNCGPLSNICWRRIYNGNADWKQTLPMCSVLYLLPDKQRPWNTHASAQWKEVSPLQPMWSLSHQCFWAENPHAGS